MVSLPTCGLSLKVIQIKYGKHNEKEKRKEDAPQEKYKTNSSKGKIEKRQIEVRERDWIERFEPVRLETQLMSSSLW